MPDAKAAADKEWDKLEKIPAWNLTKVRCKKEVIDEARTKGIKVHFASLMDICHLKNAELEAKHQKYKGRVVLRGDIVKDDFGSFAVFNEHGSSASQMTAAKIMDIYFQIAGLRWTSSRRSISLPAWQVTKVKIKREVILEAQKRAKNSPLCYADGHRSSRECGVRTEVSKFSKAGSCSEVTLRKTILDLMLHSQSKVRLRLK